MAYLITTTNEYGNARTPIIIETDDISMALGKFYKHVYNEIKDQFENIADYINDNNIPDIETLYERGSHIYKITMETTLIRINAYNNNFDARTEWNLYDMKDFNVIK